MKVGTLLAVITLCLSIGAVCYIGGKEMDQRHEIKMQTMIQDYNRSILSIQLYSMEARKIPNKSM